jgi:hypothetical protein
MFFYLFSFRPFFIGDLFRILFKIVILKLGLLGI